MNKDPMYLERQSVGSSSQMCSGWQTGVLLFVKHIFFISLLKELYLTSPLRGFLIKK